MEVRGLHKCIFPGKPIIPFSISCLEIAFIGFNVPTTAVFHFHLVDLHIQQTVCVLLGHLHETEASLIIIINATALPAMNNQKACVCFKKKKVYPLNIFNNLTYGSKHV